MLSLKKLQGFNKGQTLMPESFLVLFHNYWLRLFSFELNDEARHIVQTVAAVQTGGIQTVVAQLKQKNEYALFTVI